MSGLAQTLCRSRTTSRAGCPIMAPLPSGWGTSLEACSAGGAEVGRIVVARAAGRLLVPAAPAVIDNHTQLGAFARNGDRIVKSDFDAGVFTSDDFYCSDPPGHGSRRSQRAR